MRGNTHRKQVSLVFTGDEFADGGSHIRNVLRDKNVKSSFFLTGNFYGREEFGELIKGLKRDGHYLGAHSDKHLLYADWVKRDSSLVDERQFVDDLRANYLKMEAFGITKRQARYFLPPFEWYNRRIAEWVQKEGLELINYTPGTRTTTDYTFPEMGSVYRSSAEILESVFEREKKDPDGLNGYIILVHIGTDPRRTDKFYLRLAEMVDRIKMLGYKFVKLEEL